MMSGPPDSIHQLAYKGDLEAIKVKVAENNRLLSKEDESGRVALHWSATGGRAQVAQFLLDQGAEVDPLDDSRWTPLIIAASAGHEDVARILLGKGAKVDSCTDQGRSALLYACSRNRDGIARMLLDNHADINLQDKLGSSPLHRAASTGHVKIVKLLLEYSNQLEKDQQDKWKNTALHLACEDDAHVEVAKLLVEAGASQTIVNKEEKMPLQMAKPEVVRVLRQFMDAVDL